MIPEVISNATGVSISSEIKITQTKIYLIVFNKIKYITKHFIHMVCFLKIISLRSLSQFSLYTVRQRNLTTYITGCEELG
jgi:hypothetical protein